MFDSFDNVFQSFAGFTTALTIAVLVVLGVLVAIRRIRGRKQILFDPWSDLRPEPDEVLGRSIGEMLLHRLGTIQSVHERSVGQVEISNTYRDIPIFSQGLDEDLELLGSAELGSTPGAVTALFVFLLRAFPFLSPPTRLQGSIHLYDGRYRLQAILRNYKPSGSKSSTTRLWEVESAGESRGSIPAAVEELAYRIYLDLLHDQAFKSWSCFREFTIGVDRHINFMELGRPQDNRDAEQHYRAALALEKQNQVVGYNLGVLIYMRFESNRTNDEALDLFRSTLTAPNDRLRARANSAMANALITRVHRFSKKGEGRREDLEEALELAEDAVALQPGLDAAAKARAYAHHQLGEWIFLRSEGDAGLAKQADHHRSEGLKGYQRALELNPNHFLAANNLANLLLEWAKSEDRRRTELLAEAERWAGRALQISPGFHLAHDNIGNIRLEGGDYAGALRAFQTALRFKPDYPEANNDIALVHLDAGYPGSSAAEATRIHRVALGLTAEGSLRHREKLCGQMIDRALELRAGKRLVDGFAPDAASDPRCSCPGLWERRAQ